MSAAYRVDGLLVDSDDFYARACDPQRSVVVEACAGAGKTWMLVSRILRALLAGAQPQQILAITFTRKAAGEMRERLDEWLRTYSAVGGSTEARVKGLIDRGMSAAAARAQADALGALHEQILRAGRSVEVRTFHAWFAQLLSHAPLSLLEALQLPAQYELLEDQSALGAGLFRRFHRAVQADAALRADYMALVARHRRSTVQQWLVAAWHAWPELSRADAAGAVADAVPSAAMLWPECRGLTDPAELLQLEPLAQTIVALARELGARGMSKSDEAAKGLIEALAAQDGEAAFDKAWGALFTKDGEPRKQLGDSPSLRAVVDSLTRIRSMRLQHFGHQDQAQMLRLSRVLLKEYAALKLRLGLVDMPDLERVAEVLLGDGELSGWVQERLDQRLRHVLIDEFQDTNPLQWQVLHGWLSAYAGAGGGASGQRPLSLFIVGDPKQSIYRFRGADPRVFEAAREFVLHGLDGSLLQCDHTRRNAPVVIEVLNAVFEDAALLDGWGPYRTHTTDSTAAGAVLRLAGVRRPGKSIKPAAAEVWRDSLTQPRSEPEQRLRAAEAEQVAHAVVGLMQVHAIAPSDVMVLARKRSTLAEVALALAAHDVPHVVAETLALHESPEALDLIALLDSLASPGHDLSLARALKSPVFSASDDDLLWLSRTASPARSWQAALLGSSNLPTATLRRAQQLLRAWCNAADFLPPHDLLDRIVDEGDVLARMAATVPVARRALALHAVDALLAAALSQQGGRFVSLYGFVRGLRAGRVRSPPATPIDAVQLLTVHGAKGLEARAVVIADADPEPNPMMRATLLVDWVVDEPAPRRVAFVHSESRLPPSLQGMWAREADAVCREELNGLYVAMTRAREWLVFSRTEPYSPRGGRSWWARAKGHAARSMESRSDQQPGWPQPRDTADTASVPVLPALHWQSAPASAAGLADAAAARLGQAVHRVLEWAAQSEVTAGFDRRRAAESAALAFALPPNGASRVLQIATQILDSPTCARFFTGTGLRWAGNEVPVAWQGESLRIDRLVALADDPAAPATWWVLDYKLRGSPAQLPAYRAQMQRYVEAVQALQPGEAVRGAFITGAGELIEL